MRTTFRLLAAVERSSRFLEPGAPTGLTGLPTHGSPRSALLFLYNATLEKLKQFPEHSVYRQSTEALTKHRLKVIEDTRPAGLQQWQERVQPLLEKYPQALRKIPLSTGSGSSDFNIVWREADVEAKEEGGEGEDGEARSGILPAIREGPAYGDEEAEAIVKILKRAEAFQARVRVEIEPEPPLTVEQINEVETKLSAGLIEEIIEVAEAENDLVDVLLEHMVWEDLEEKPVEGQWTYHERDRHTKAEEAKQ